MYFMKTLTLLLRIENVFGITRLCWNEKRVTVNKSYSLVSFTVALITCLFYNTTNRNRFSTFDFWHLTLAFMNSIIIILNGYCSSQKFTKLIACLRESHLILRKQNSKQIKLIHRVVIQRLIIYSVMLAVMFYLMLLHKEEGSPLQMYIFKFVLFTCDARFLLEYVVYFFIFYILSIQINSLSSTISKSGDDSASQKIDISNCYLVYNRISESGKLFKEAFGFQIALSVLTTIIYVIFIVCNFIIIACNNFESNVRVHIILTYVMLMPNIVTLFTMSLAGQQVQNSFEKFNRVLAGLLLRLDSKREQKKLVKNLIRLVSSRPVKPEAYGSIPIGNALILRSLGFVTTSIIIILQFNNIV